MATVERVAAPLPPDDDIVRALKVGDEAMFARVLDAWSGGLLRAARAFVGSVDAAEDVLQETWLAVLRGIRAFEGRSSLRTWVYGILVNRAKSYAARERRLVPVIDVQPEDHGPTVDPARFRGPDDRYPGGWRQFPAPWPSAEVEVVAHEMRRHIEAAIGDLPERQRVVITLRDIDGYSADEVCGMLDISPGNQRVLLHRARAGVRGRLEAYFSAQL